MDNLKVTNFIHKWNLYQPSMIQSIDEKLWRRTLSYFKVKQIYAVGALHCRGNRGENDQNQCCKRIFKPNQKKVKSKIWVVASLAVIQDSHALNHFEQYCQKSNNL